MEIKSRQPGAMHDLKLFMIGAAVESDVAATVSMPAVSVVRALKRTAHVPIASRQSTAAVKMLQPQSPHRTMGLQTVFRAHNHLTTATNTSFLLEYFLAVEKTLSAGAVEAGIDRYFLASLAT